MGGDCARTPHSLPAPARALLLTPSLPIALCAKKKIYEKPVEETDPN